MNYPIVQSVTVEQLQKLHYDRIGSEYESHYGDACSGEYRKQFINEPMFAGIDLRGLDVLEAMCGSGQTTEFLRSKGARVTGLDISPDEIDSFQRRWPGSEAKCGSILSSGFASDSFDCVAVVGGLHHLHPHLSDGMREIHRILKPGGRLCFAEPHQCSIPDRVRSFWYKHDDLFASNEASIDLESLKKEFSGAFSFEKEDYLGNLAYLLVLNSMIFRIPLKLKRWYTPLLLTSEALINRLQRKWSACFVVSQWKKLEQPRAESGNLSLSSGAESVDLHGEDR